MQRNSGLWLALILVGCQPSTPTDTVESLIADPERLKDVQRQCKLDRERVADDVCNAASEAFRQRFMGDRTVDYMPKHPPKQRSNAKEE